MTLSELLDSDAPTLEKLTDAQLLEYFKPYLSVTRPELARTAHASTSSVGKHYAEQKQLPIYNDKQRAALELMASEGVDVSFMKRRLKK